MNVVTVKLGGIQGGVDGHKIIFSLGAWFSCVEQKDRVDLSVIESAATAQ